MVPPLGVIDFDEGAASALNQRPFHLDLRTLAKVATNRTWFPYWEQAGQGVVAVAGADVQRRILLAGRALAASSLEIVEVRGIGSPATTTTRRSPPRRG